jgi:predicted glutamine amidotransferase
MASQSHVNAQPYLDETLGVAFAHNGYFRQHGRHRPEVADQLEGTSDSEVGFRLWTTALAAARPGAAALVETHRRLEGHANIMTVSAAGELLVYAGNPENRCYTFAAEGLKVAVTALHSADRYVFDAVFPQARAVTVIPLDTVASLA